jgi:hypothetical protein
MLKHFTSPATSADNILLQMACFRETYFLRKVVFPDTKQKEIFSVTFNVGHDIRAHWKSASNFTEERLDMNSFV